MHRNVCACIIKNTCYLSPIIVEKVGLIALLRYYRVGQLFMITQWGKLYYKVGQLCYYKLGRFYYEVGQLFVITKWEEVYYKVGRVLQSGL